MFPGRPSLGGAPARFSSHHRHKLIMAQRRRDQLQSLSALWRNPVARAWIYQISVVVAVGAAAYTIFQNTIKNLEERGISSGFSYLVNEAGFGIGEILPVPNLTGGLVHLLIAIVAGLFLVFLLSQWQKRRGKTIGSELRLVIMVFILLFGVPVAVLFYSGDTITAIRYTEANSYGVALMVGLLNTFKVSLIGCVLATLLGLFLGISRLSSNWLVAKLSETYIEIIRNIPLLVQLFFVYIAVLRTMPSPKNSLRFFDVVILNNRGLYLPAPIPQPFADLFILSIALTGIGIFFWSRHATQRRNSTGEQLPVFLPSVAALVVIPGMVWLISGTPFQLEYAVLRGFNFQGGLEMSPEFTAMLIGLTLYTAAFIAEIVRSGIQAVSKGQREAAQSLGLRTGHTMRLIILPQAMRVMIPPLTSQYLNLTKNSSLGVAIGFAEVVNVSGTIINQSGQAIEPIALTMLIYLTFSLSISTLMNWYNAKMRLVER